MTLCCDLDLADPSPQLPLRPAPAWVLVRCGDHVLGEVRLPAGDDRFRDEIRLEIERRFAEVIRARQVLEAEMPDDVHPDDVAVVVCTRDRTHHLEPCLRSLDSLDPPPGEIIVVDNASRDAMTRAIAERFGCRYVREDQPGLNHARNAGWRTSERSVVAFVDDDGRADRRFAAAVARGFATDEIGIVTGLVRPAELVSAAQYAFERFEGGMSKGYERRLFHRDRAPVGLQAYRCGVGTNMAVRREVLKALDGFDVRIGVGQPTRGGCDLDLFARALDAGLVIAYEPDAVVRHVHRRTFSGLDAQMRDYGLSFPSLLRLHAREGRADPRAVAREIRRWHWRRHVRRPLTALRRRNWSVVALSLAELRGSLAAGRALAATPPAPET